MFKPKKKDKNIYKSFDQWNAENANKGANEPNKPVEKKTYETGKKKTVYRRFGDNKDLKEIFPRKEDNTKGSISKDHEVIMDKKSHEGKVHSKGSIDTRPSMGREGSAGSNYSGVNPDLRRRLEEKKAKERRAAAELRRSKEVAARAKKIKAQQDVFKNKKDLRKAIITSEILGPPKAKKFS